MEINSVTASVAKNLPQQQAPAARQEPKFQDVETARQSNDAPQARESRSAPKPAQAQQAERSRQPERGEQPEPPLPKPVVNAQGQKTGTIINTTA